MSRRNQGFPSAQALFRYVFVFVLFILYALWLEYDRTWYPLRLRASRLDGGAPPPLPFIPAFHTVRVYLATANNLSSY